MTEYLIGLTGFVNASGRLPGHTPNAPHGALPGGHGTTDDQDGVVAADGAQNVGPALSVEGGRDRLGATRHGAEDDHLADAIDAEKKLGKEGIESGPALLYTAVGNGVSGSLGGRHPGQAQLAEIAGESCLGYIPATL